MSARGVWCQITLPEGRTPRGKGYLTQTRGLTPSRGSNSVINQILYIIKHLALYLCLLMYPRPFVCPAIKIPLSVKVKAIPYANLRIPRILLVEPGQGHSYANEFRDRLTGHAIIHSSFVHSKIQRWKCPALAIARHVNTTQTAIMSAWHYCFIPPICSSRLYILITISKHDAWSPKVFLFDGNECHLAPCIPSSWNF